MFRIAKLVAISSTSYGTTKEGRFRVSGFEKYDIELLPENILGDVHDLSLGDMVQLVFVDDRILVRTL